MVVLEMDFLFRPL